MGARLPLCITGAVLMLVSTFLPTLYCYIYMEFLGVEVNGTFYYWMYGLIYAEITEEYLGVTYTSTYIGFEPDILGIICMFIIIGGAIIALVLGIATEDNKAAIVGGLLGIFGIVFFYVGVLIGLPISSLHEVTEAGFYFVPFIGFYMCIVGGILALVGGALSKY
jgi:hypothetical protein